MKLALQLTIAAIILAVVIPTLFSTANAAQAIGSKRNQEIEQVQALFE
jgi:hypothetical protein